MLNNYAATYEYCNAYAFLTQFSEIAELNYSFLSELLTRWSLILSSEAAPYWQDMIMLFEQDYLNWYLIGLRNGLLFKKLFDIKIAS
jgi:hypothetical protein